MSQKRVSKGELISRIAECNKVTKKESSILIDNFVKQIIHSLTAGETVSLPGFATFKTKHKEERFGRNPKTGEKIKIPASMSIVVKFNKLAKEAINQKKKK